MGTSAVGIFAASTVAEPCWGSRMKKRRRTPPFRGVLDQSSAKRPHKHQEFTSRSWSSSSVPSAEDEPSQLHTLHNITSCSGLRLKLCLVYVVLGFFLSGFRALVEHLLVYVALPSAADPKVVPHTAHSQQPAFGPPA